MMKASASSRASSHRGALPKTEDTEIILKSRRHTNSLKPSSAKTGFRQLADPAAAFCGSTLPPIVHGPHVFPGNLCLPPPSIAEETS
ncbi:hypothetical protein EYF80_044954 [Liparis tanakae]|uniref:Uncharacterized protein n=1 Tax=Liparis tanakae TaxID=230148 RepID=A0A4Z2FUE0_9TELE|nr:hypothetical protein EYF80_044954 [Liparis tanakae]